MELKNFNSKELLDLVALAIVADVMPLTHINRTMLICRVFPGQDLGRGQKEGPFY